MLVDSPFFTRSLACLQRPEGALTAMLMGRNTVKRTRCLWVISAVRSAIRAAAGRVRGRRRARCAGAASCRRHSRMRGDTQHENRRTVHLRPPARRRRRLGDLAHNRLQAGRHRRRRSRARGRGVAGDLLRGRPQALWRLDPLRHLQRGPVGLGGVVLDRNRAPLGERPVARWCPGLAPCARRGRAGAAGALDTRRHGAGPALGRGGGPRDQESRRR